MQNNNTNTIKNIKAKDEVIMNSEESKLNIENKDVSSQKIELDVIATERTVSSQKTRKSKEEQLQLALAKKQALDLKIQRYQKELRDKNQKNRNRGLILLGIVVEQHLKNKSITIPNQADIDWWLSQHAILPDKDQEVYINFLNSLVDEKTVDTKENNYEIKIE